MINSLGKGAGGYFSKLIFENIKLNGIQHYFLYKTKYRNTPIRLSVAYLIRIKIRGKGYLLVKNTKIPNQFQPVGGVYKYKKEGEEFLRKIDFRDDDGYTPNSNNKNDLRIRVVGKNYSKFITWFKNKCGREITPYREFKEELIDTKILTEKDFEEENVDLRHKKLNIGDLHYSPYFDCQEILIADIYEFLPNEKQLKKLEGLLSETEHYRFFTYDEIKRLGKISGDKEYRVGEHSWKILEGDE